MILGVSWILYSSVRAVTSGSADVARENAELVHSLQETLGISIEAAVQNAILGETVALVANSYYLLHFPVTVLVLGAVFMRERRTMFPVVRDGLVLMTFVGLAVHLVFPLAPPRMLDGIADASTMHGPNPYDLPGSGAANQFAAMPSMHVAWAIVAGWVLVRLSGSTVVRAVGVLHPLATIVVVVVTGHHFVLDAIVGSLLAVVSLLGASFVHREGRRLGEKAAVVHSPSTVEMARIRAISPSYPLVAHKDSLAPLKVCKIPSSGRASAHDSAVTSSSSPTGDGLSHPVVTMRTCNASP